MAKNAADGWARAQELDERVRDLEAQLAAAWDQAHQLDTALKAEVEARTTYTTYLSEANYNADGLMVWLKAVPFMTNPEFMAAYAAGMDSGHHIFRAPGSHDDIHLEWRTHVVVWAAEHATRLEGDFVECGVNTRHVLVGDLQVPRFQPA